ncbi:ParB/RepB/Spo0J family partition protein [Porphyrobacter algicida]|uniref:ParB/RepB/Spo0J family partition protein n=1 Tax=Qipengyuania algicida TaxID=1836209 RepID=A0A845AHP2_9SPHN|nr:ParB/RepB/Spo0J family partition protein [Qipengyuania algicida]MXP30162.1 ParB/RepB/Spo0J family partition protein [Qipengyuania algicida]
MQIKHIPLTHLSISKVNMRRGRKTPEISDILPSIKKRGVLSPLFVRANGSPDHFEILAGKRRYFASVEAAKECEEDRSLPCIVLGEGDDAEALEISMIENLLRQDPDQVTQWESYTRLVKEGRSVEDIAATFALTELQVKRILALGNLLPRIREAFRAEEVDAATIKHLTLASKAQQKAWLALFEDAEAYAPRGSQLKSWLFGGASIATGVALFDLEAYSGQIIADLFGEEGYFADSDAFWAAQMAEVEACKAAYLEAGWSDVVIVPPIEHFSTWEYEHASKRKGGRVYIQLRHNGEVIVHEGYITRREAQAASKRGVDCADAKPSRPELTAAMTNYVDLHRHAALRQAVAGEPWLALRIMVAHAICGSPLWSVKPADTHSRNENIAASLGASSAARGFAERRRAMLVLLGFESEREAICQDRYGSDVVPILHRLIALDDDTVMQAMAMVMAETLAIGSDCVEYLGDHLSVDMADYWQVDEAFFDLIRDREVMSAILAEVGGEAVVGANAKEKGSVIKGVIADHFTGENDRPRIERWVPRWMAFPPSAYTARGGVATVAAAERARWMIESDEAEQAEIVEPEVPCDETAKAVEPSEAEPLAA